MVLHAHGPAPGHSGLCHAWRSAGTRPHPLSLLLPLPHPRPALAAGRFTRPDKTRAFTIARGEGVEAFAALEPAAFAGDAEPADVERCLPIASRLYGLLTGLIK